MNIKMNCICYFQINKDKNENKNEDNNKVNNDDNNKY